MSRFVFSAIGLVVISAGQLCAQTSDAPLRDPFGRDGIAPAPPQRKNHARLTSDLADQAKAGVPSQPEGLYPSVVVTVAYQRIDRALSRETFLEYLDQDLKAVIEDISFNHNIPIVIDTKALEAGGIDTGMRVTKSLKGTSLRAALRLMLRDIGLAFVIRDEVLQITTPEVAEAASSTRFYRVSELLPSSGDGEALVELIKTLVAPETWCGSASRGAIVYVERLESLAIRQTDEVFQEIEELLATTKRLAEK